MQDMNEIKTFETHPDHHTVGSTFLAWDGLIYFCDSYDPRQGYWMTQVGNPSIRRNVSERAIGKVFHVVRWIHTAIHNRHVDGYLKP